MPCNLRVQPYGLVQDVIFLPYVKPVTEITFVSLILECRKRLSH
jgi:hypothetical protein